MLKTIVIPIHGRRWDSLALLRDSYNNRTKDHTQINISVIDNTKGVSLEPWLKGFKCNSARIIENSSPKAISKNWNIGIQKADSEWSLVINDDVEFTIRWDAILDDLIEKKNRGLLALCKPNSFSGFAISKSFCQQYGYFREDYETAGYEDEDYILTVARKAEIRTCEELYKKVIYSYNREFKKGLIIHRPLMTKFRGEGWIVENKNKAIFHKFWTPSAKTEDTYQGKSGKYYRYIGEDCEKD